MSKFSFDDFPKAEGAPAFDFEQFEAVEQKDDKSLGEKAALVARNFVQGATGNFSDEAAGVVEGAGRVIGLQGLGGPLKDVRLAEGGPTIDPDAIKAAYQAGRDAERATLNKDSVENPGLSTSSQLVGAVASPINKVAKGVSLAKGGAMIGGISGLGGSEADDLGGMLVDSATGATIGAVTGKVLEKGAPVLKKATEKVGAKAGEIAERMAARAVGAERATVKKLGMGKVRDIGRHALDEGILSPLASTDDLIARNTAAEARGVSKMNEAYRAIDDAGASTFNPLDVATKVDDQIGGFYRSPINRGETRQLENTLETILMRGEGNIPLKEAQVLKQELGKVANWKNNLNLTDKERMAREAYGIVSKAIDDAAESGSKAIGKEGLAETLRQGKVLVGRSKGAEELLKNKAAREQGQKLGFGLTDTIWGGAALGYGGMTNDWKTAGGLMLAKKGLEKYGAQNAALALNKVSKAFLKSPDIAEVAKKSPAVVQAIVSRLEGKSPSLPRAGDGGEEQAQLKGKEKWTVAGFDKVRKHSGGNLLEDPVVASRVLSSPRGVELLMAASDLKPGSKAMESVLSKLKTQFAKESP